MGEEQVGAQSLSGALVEAIADAEGEDPAELDYSLYDYIDLEAVDALVADPDADFRLECTVADHTVTVESGGRITVDGTDYRWGPE